LNNRAELLRLLEPGQHYHKCITPPDGAWVKHVEQHIAERDGDLERAIAIQAELEAGLLIRPSLS
jgi:hypothetical protein